MSQPFLKPGAQGKERIEPNPVDLGANLLPQSPERSQVLAEELEVTKPDLREELLEIGCVVVSFVELPVLGGEHVPIGNAD